MLVTALPSPDGIKFQYQFWLVFPTIALSTDKLLMPYFSTLFFYSFNELPEDILINIYKISFHIEPLLLSFRYRIRSFSPQEKATSTTSFLLYLPNIIFIPLLHTHFALFFVYQVAILHYFLHSIRYIQPKTLVHFMARMWPMPLFWYSSLSSVSSPLLSPSRMADMLFP